MKILRILLPILLATSSSTALAVANATDSSVALNGESIMNQVKWREDGENRRSQLDITLTEKDGFIRKRAVS